LLQFLPLDLVAGPLGFRWFGVVWGRGVVLGAEVVNASTSAWVAGWSAGFVVVV
jgi:hypothetical protein